jgi:hypothetical protein
MASRLRFYLQDGGWLVLCGENERNRSVCYPLTTELLSVLSSENKTPKVRPPRDPSIVRSEWVRYEEAIYDSLAEQGLGVEDFKVFITHESETFEIVVLDTQDERYIQLGWINKSGKTVFLSEYYEPNKYMVKTVSYQVMLSHFNPEFARIADLARYTSLYPTEDSVIIDYQGQDLSTEFRQNTVGHFEFVGDWSSRWTIRVKLTPTAEYEKFENITVIGLCSFVSSSKSVQSLKNPLKGMRRVEQWVYDIEYRSKTWRFSEKTK